MYNWKKISFEQILEDYDFMQRELDSPSRSNLTETVLSINCDTITLQECEEIVFVLKSSLSTVAILLRAQKSHEMAGDVTTLEQAKNYNDGPVFYTRYVTKMFYQAICDYLFNSERIKLLAFKNMIFSSDFQPICSGLNNNKSLKILFFKSCDVSDERCSKICQALRKSPVEVLGLENCNITSFGVSWICWLLKEQSMLRILSKWSPNKYQNEYFYKGDQGVKKLCLNDNPKIVDNGAQLLVAALNDDKWVLQVHLQNTGITNATCKQLVNLSENSIIEVFDVMRNNITSTSTLALAVENMSKNKSKINRSVLRKPNKNPKNKLTMKTIVKHPSEISLSNSDSSCVNSTENQRFSSHVTIKSKLKNKKSKKSNNNNYNVSDKIKVPMDWSLETKDLIDFFTKTEKQKSSRTAKGKGSINNITLLCQNQ